MDDDEIRDLVWLDILRVVCVAGIALCVLLLSPSCEFRIEIDSKPPEDER